MYWKPARFNNAVLLSKRVWDDQALFLLVEYRIDVLPYLMSFNPFVHINCLLSSSIPNSQSQIYIFYKIRPWPMFLPLTSSSDYSVVVYTPIKKCIKSVTFIFAVGNKCVLSAKTVFMSNIQAHWCHCRYVKIRSLRVDKSDLAPDLAPQLLRL